MENFCQLILNGVLLGGLYATIAMGLSTILGIVKMINLAHGDFMILGSYLSFAFMHWIGVNPFWTFFLVIPVMFFIGFFLQSLILNRVVGKGMEPSLILTFGLSIIIQNSLLLFFTPDSRSLMTPLSVKTIPVTEFLNIPLLYLINFFIALGAIFILHLIFQKTYLGRAIRAASDDEGAAKLMGINTKRIYAFAMGIAMMTAGVAGVQVGMAFLFYPHTGPQYLIIAFGVMVIGGLGSMKGTFIGGLILALSQLIGAQLGGIGNQLLSGYIVLLIVLAIRPQGVFGEG
jgi:branched-chain amino acid transport system permease protein